MIGKLLCWVGLHEWLGPISLNVNGAQTVLWLCPRCGKDFSLSQRQQPQPPGPPPQPRLAPDTIPPEGELLKTA